MQFHTRITFFYNSKIAIINNVYPEPDPAINFWKWFGQQTEITDIMAIESTENSN